MSPFTGHMYSIVVLCVAGVVLAFDRGRQLFGTDHCAMHQNVVFSKLNIKSAKKRQWLITTVTPRLLSLPTYNSASDMFAVLTFLH